MAHWAEIDSNNIVLRILVGDNNDPAGDEIWDQNPYVPVFKIESYCSCAGVCPHPELFIDDYTVVTMYSLLTWRQ